MDSLTGYYCVQLTSPVTADPRTDLNHLRKSPEGRFFLTLKNHPGSTDERSAKEPMLNGKLW